MSDLPTGPGSWQASDGKWYPPQGPPSGPPGFQPASGPTGFQPAIPSPAAPSPTKTRGGFGMGAIVGVLVGLLIGGLAAALLGLQIGGDDASPKLSLGGNGQSVTVGGDEANTPPEPATTRDAPAPVGTVVALGNGWSVSVTSFDSSFTPDSDSGGEPAPDGKRFVVVGLSASYDGAKDSESPFFGMDLSLVGSAGVERSTTNSNCFAPDPQLGSLDDVYKGGTASGNLCITVDDAEVGSLVLVAEPGASFDAQKSYLALE